MGISVLIMVVLLNNVFVSSKLFHFDGKLLGRNPSARVNKHLKITEACSNALLPASQNKQWNKAREVLGMPPFRMDNSYFSYSRKIKAFYSFSPGISVFNISSNIVPYVLVWKGGNDAIRGNLLREEQKYSGVKTGPQQHIFDNPGADINHMTYLSRIKQFYFRSDHIKSPPSFTFVREPIDHFVSGLTEYYFRCFKKKIVTAQDIRREITDLADFKALFRDADSCNKLNVYSVRHVYPMSGILVDYGKDDYNIQFIGKLENFEEDWYKMNEMYGIHIDFDHHIGVHPSTKDPNSVHKAFAEIKNSTSKEDQAIMKTLCHILHVDYVCFGYSFPTFCTD